LAGVPMGTGMATPSASAMISVPAASIVIEMPVGVDQMSIRIAAKAVGGLQDSLAGRGDLRASMNTCHFEKKNFFFFVVFFFSGAA